MIRTFKDYRTALYENEVKDSSNRYYGQEPTWVQTRKLAKHSREPYWQLRLGIFDVHGKCVLIARTSQRGRVSWERTRLADNWKRATKDAIERAETTDKRCV